MRRVLTSYNSTFAAERTERTSRRYRLCVVLCRVMRRVLTSYNSTFAAERTERTSRRYRLCVVLCRVMGQVFWLVRLNF
jgi:hypothetical protein